MKKTRFLPLLVLMVILGSVLTACTGGAGVVSSFPGILVDKASDTAYLASGAHVYSVNLANGTERWRYPEKADPKSTFYGAPALTEDGQLIQGGFDHKLYGLNLGTRLPNWTFANATDVFVAQPLVVGSTVYAPNSDKSIYAVDKTGALLWKAQATHAMWSTPVTDGTLIYAGSMDHHVYAFKQESGSQVWKSEDLGGALVGALALSPKNVLYIGTISSKMAALDATSGKTLWQAPAKGWVWADPLIAGDLVVFTDLEGYIYALDAASGAVKWQVQPDTGANRAITAAPVVVENTLYVASQAGVLYALDLATGAVSWNKTIGGKIYSDLVLAGDHLLIAPMEFTSALVSVDLQGNVSWNYTPAK
jgi:eukaryotic-like serine/threonine-protein kinase